MNNANRGKKWDKNDGILLKKCIDENISLEITAEKLGRTELAIVIRSLTHFNYLFNESESILSNKGYYEKYKSKIISLKDGEIEIGSIVDEKLSIKESKNEFTTLPRLINAVNINDNSDSPLNSDKKTMFFQSVGSLPKYVNLSSFSNNFNQYIRPITQWRLDCFNKPGIKINKDFEIVLNQAVNIMTRGSITYTTPELKKTLNKLCELNSNETELEIASINIARHPTNSFDLNSKTNLFDSDLEYEFWKKIKSQTKNVYGLNIIPQISLDSITTGLNPSDQRVVDFYFWNSLSSSKPLVVEIDGSQHLKQELSDSNRDGQLKSFDNKVIRLTYDDVIKNYDFITANDLNNDTKFDDQFDKDMNDKTKNIEYVMRVCKYVHQIQLSVLYSLFYGYSDNKQNEYNIGIYIPQILKCEQINISKAIDLGLNDLNDMLSNLCDLYGYKIKIPKFKFNEIFDDNNDINITNTSNLNDNLNNFIISDISLPYDISNPEKFSDQPKEQKLNIKTGEWFLYYLFDHPNFREGQFEAIVNSLEKKDEILLLKTSGGKSLIYQYVGLLSPGITIIVSPLISLIEDQVANLSFNGFTKSLGISQLTNRVIKSKQDLKTVISNGFYKYIYVSPERFQMDDFRDTVQSIITKYPISNVAIDEAHCVSEWGHDFRISYLNLTNTIRKHCKFKGKPPVITALTGTASVHVLRDMQRELNIKNYNSKSNMERSEIDFLTINCHTSQKNMMLIENLNSLPGKFNTSYEKFYSINNEQSYCGIIFGIHVDGKLGVTQIQNQIESKMEINNPPLIYSGRPPRSFRTTNNKWQIQKQNNADKFRKNQNLIMIATMSFGMGIDKPNIRYTIHNNLPRSIEAYYQECGRSGRDGKYSLSIIMFSDDNKELNDKLLDPLTTVEEIDSHISPKEYRKKQDDIGRLLWFHINSFKGKTRDFDSLIDCYNLIPQTNSLSCTLSWYKEYVFDPKTRKPKDVFDSENKTALEIPIHRLSILGFVNDYTVDHSKQCFNINLSKPNSNIIVQNLKNYITSYRPDRITPEWIIDLENNFNNYTFDEIIELCSKKLIDFLYETVESHRRASLSMMREAANETPQGLRKRIESYLTNENPQIEYDLDQILNFGANNQFELIFKLLNENNYNESFNLRGSVDRRIEDYADNPYLRILKFATEIICKGKQETIIRNIILAVELSSSENFKIKNTIVLSNIITIMNNLIERNLLGQSLRDTILNGLLDSKEFDDNLKKFIIYQVNLKFEIDSDLVIIFDVYLSRLIVHNVKQLSKLVK